jgi:TATA-box binding protein (TBP) (component of TFIID and TFIIIB)
MALSISTTNNNNNNIDDEWSSFLTTKYDDHEDNNNLQDVSVASTQDLDQTDIFIGNVPEPTEIYISTKSKIAYLEQPIDLNIFWRIPVIPYATPSNGVIKKQIKLNSKTQDDLIAVQECLKNELYYDEHIISRIDNPNGRIKFKDIRKITVGISKKDMTNYRSKKKKAFYNCFVVIIRIKIDTAFREFHVKMFHSGKLEIPGVQSDKIYEIVLHNIIDILQPFHDYTLQYKQKSDIILINSNFSCGFFINREILYDILRNKYNIQAIYDPCSYPGIQCKFYYNNDIGVQSGMQITTENKEKYKNIIAVSFMIFRTGSVLIVGMCEENVLDDIYQFLKALLRSEFKYICQKIITEEDLILKDKKKKPRKKIMHIITGVIEDDNGLTNGLVDNVLTNGLEDNGLVDNDLTNDLTNVLVEDNVLVAEVENLFITPSLKKGKKQKPKLEFDIIDDNIEEEVTP